MRFLFYHHGPHGPFSLQQLYGGEARFGGGVLRLRILFWIAARGHEVHLIGNVETGEWQGVRATAGIRNLESVMGNCSTVEPSVVVLNNPPDEAQWRWIQNLKNDRLRIVLWAGNPFNLIWLRRVVSGDLDRIVCVSHTHREYYRLHRGFERIEASYSGVDTDLIAAAPARPRSTGTVLSVSIPRRTKGFHNLLRAWNAVRRAVPDARLRVCGSARMHGPGTVLGRTGVLDADLEAEFPEFFGDHPHSTERAGVELMGARDLPEVYSDLKAAAVAVVNSNWRGSVETFCRSAVEAQVAGTPVVGAARGALPEVVAHGKTGLLVDEEDPVALAEAIITLLKDEALRRQMGAAGREWARRFADYDLIAPDWEAIAQRAWSGKPAPVEPRQPHDLLRRLGYIRMRLWVHERVGRRL